MNPRWLIIALALAPAKASAEDGDMPPAGTRSLFDHIFSTEQNGTAKYDIPTSFEGVLERLRQVQGGEPLAVTIPMGRSVQRFETDLKNPRVVAAFSANSRALYQGRMLPALVDRLFVGYGKHSDQLEIISWNQDAARFEFQLVKNLSKAGEQRPVYAPRSFCTTCHIHSVPFFPRDPWEETTAFSATSQAVGKAMGFGNANLLEKRYLGVPIAFTNNSVAYGIDRSIDLAASQVTFQTMWRDACAVSGTTDDGANAVDPVGCRARLVKLGFRYLLSFSVMPNSNEYKALQATMLPKAKAVFGDFVKFPVSDLRTRNPLTAAGGYDPTNGQSVDGGALDSTDATLDLLKSRTSIPKQFDPLVANPATDDPYMYHPLIGVAGATPSPSGYSYPDYRATLDQPRIRKSDDAKLLSEMIVWVSGILAVDRATYVGLKGAGTEAFVKIDQAVDKLAAEAREMGKGALMGEPLTADKLLAGFGKHALNTTYKFLVDPDRPMPLAQTEIGGPVGEEHGPNNPAEVQALKDFKSYCGTCHGPSTAIDLFPGDYSNMDTDRAAKVLRRLDWERCKPEPNRSRMPPESSPNRKKLCQAQATRKAMIDTLRARVFPGVAKPCGASFTLDTPLTATAAHAANCGAGGAQ